MKYEKIWQFNSEMNFLVFNARINRTALEQTNEKLTDELKTKTTEFIKF